MREKRHDVDRVLLDGKWRLSKLLPKARRRVRDGEGVSDVVMQSALAKAQAPYMTEKNIEALVVYPAPMGGWHADIVLIDTPPGVSNSFGSPVGRPHKTREEAEESALALLTIVLWLDKQAKPKPKPPAFLFYGGAFELSSTMLNHPRASGYGSEALALERLDMVVNEMFGSAEPNTATIEALPVSDKARLLAVLHCAVLDGVFAYPPRLDRSPSGHEAPETMQ